MGLLNLTESERREILNLHNNAKIIKEQAAAPAAAAPADDKSKIMAIQTALNSKYNSNLKVDGILGQNTITALYGAMKSKSVTPKTVIPGTPDAPNPTVQKTVIPGTPDAPNPTVSGATGQPAAPATPATGTATPAATTTAAPATGTATPATASATTATPEVPAAPATPAAPLSNRDQRRQRQDLRRGNRRAMQDLRGQQRAQ
jgi:hypothetical protein